MKKNVSVIRVAICLVSILIFISCKKNTDEVLPTEPLSISLTTGQMQLIESQNVFAFDIFKKVIENADESENIIISPLSISLALSMTLNGANGETRNAMLNALRSDGIAPENINISYKDLSDALLKIDKRVLISIANSIWTENNFVVKKPFPDILTQYYNAEVESFDISDPGAPDKINSWIERNTNGLIDNMIDELNDNTVMLLINAIYFKGKWKTQFDKSQTIKSEFHKSDGKFSEVLMMKKKSDFRIFQGEGFKIAEFPYGQGNFVMDIILPEEVNGLSVLAQKLDESTFADWLIKMTKREVQVSLPRFKYGYKEKMKSILTDMGMGIAFTENADFSGISDAQLLINDVIHQAFIETNEEGTEAAAATIVDIGLTSAPLDPAVFTADRPFLYIIRETTTNSIQFMGKIADPILN